MQQLANLDCFFLAKEMHERLAGGFFENFYDYEQGVFRLRFGKESILLDLKGFAFIAEGSEAGFPAPPKQPSSFAMLLRKRLASAKLEGIKQLDFDRIFEFSFSSKQFGRVFVVVELFGKQGNMLLLDSEKRIVKPFRRVSYSVRSLADGQEYALPPSAKKHPLELKESDLSGSGRIVSFLSKQTSLAPFYLEEACARAGVSLEAKVEDLNAGERTSLLLSLGSLFEKPSPFLFLREGKPFAFSSVEMKKFSETEKKAFETVSGAVQAYYPSAQAVAAPAARVSDLDFQLASQEKAAVEFEVKAAELQGAGKWVFESQEIVGELLDAAGEKNAVKLAAIAKKNSLKARVEKTLLELEKE